MHKWNKIIVFFVVFCSPVLAHACSMCGGAVTPEKKSAYMGTTLFMAVMPLLVTGLIFSYVIWKYRTRQ